MTNRLLCSLLKCFEFSNDKDLINLVFKRFQKTIYSYRIKNGLQIFKQTGFLYYEILNERWWRCIIHSLNYFKTEISTNYYATSIITFDRIIRLYIQLVDIFW